MHVYMGKGAKQEINIVRVWVGESVGTGVTFCWCQLVCRLKCVRVRFVHKQARSQTAINRLVCLRRNKRVKRKMLISQGKGRPCSPFSCVCVRGGGAA